MQARSCEGKTLDIQLDDKTIERLLAVAALQNISTEKLAAEWLRNASKREVEKAEAIARNADMEKNGGIPHDEMMDWVDDLAAGKNI